MPLPERLARFNRWVTNPVARRFAGRLPPFAIVVHRGRRTGRMYRTPVMVFRTGGGPGGFAIALTYGPGAEWVRNLLAAEGGALRYRGRDVPVTAPRVVARDEARPALPALVRLVLGVIRCDEVLLLSRAPEERDAVLSPPDAREREPPSMER